MNEELRMALSTIICSQATILWILSGLYERGSKDQDAIQKFVDELHNFAETLLIGDEK